MIRSAAASSCEPLPSNKQVRPFASDENDQLMLHVHFAQHLERFFPQYEVSKPSTFLVASIALAETKSKVECHVGSATEPYERQHAPFATTRVVQGIAPWWNELLVLPIDAKCIGSSSALRLDLVARDPSEQEDYLVAYATMALSPVILSSTQQLPMALPLSSDASDPSLLFIAVCMSPAMMAPTVPGRLEISIQSITLSKPPDDALMTVVLSRNSVNHVVLQDAFVRSTISDSLPSVDAFLLGISASTASNTQAPLDFPIIGCIEPTALRSEMHALVYRGFQAVGKATIRLPTALEDAQDGAIVPIEAPIEMATDKGAVESIGQLRLSARYWGPSAWIFFLRTRTGRRVVCTKRTNLSRQQQPSWLGAILRGLNRSPVASLCDDGGVTTVLVRLLGESGSTTNQPVQEEKQPPPQQMSQEEQESNSLMHVLQQQIVHLQRELTTKQQLIERLQHDLDARSNAIKMCGQDLVNLRRELRIRDERIEIMTASIKELEQRENQRMQEILSTSDPSTLRSDSVASQKLSLLLIKYKELEQKHQEALQQADATNAKLQQMEFVQRQYSNLEQAHLQQAAQVQRLQLSNQEVVRLKKTIKIQEQVIRKLETNGSSRPHANGKPQLDDDDDEEDALAVRVQVLEDQLQRNAKQAAAEISALKLRIMELEAQVHTQF